MTREALKAQIEASIKVFESQCKAMGMKPKLVGDLKAGFCDGAWSVYRLTAEGIEAEPAKVG